MDSDIISDNIIEETVENIDSDSELSGNISSSRSYSPISRRSNSPEEEEVKLACDEEVKKHLTALAKNKSELAKFPSWIDIESCLI